MVQQQENAAGRTNVEVCGVKRNAVPLLVGLMQFIGRIGKRHEELLIAPYPAYVLWWTGIGAVHDPRFGMF